jgi:adenylyl- and sulfurtransferase ThiI
VSSPRHHYTCSYRQAGKLVQQLMYTAVKHGQVGPEEHVICALSGGVDSTVAATLVHKVCSSISVAAFTQLGQHTQKRCKMFSAWHPALWWNSAEPTFECMFTWAQ